MEIQEYDKLINGVKISIRGDRICNNISIQNDYEGLVNIYYKDKYVGIGEMKNNILRRKIIL